MRRIRRMCYPIAALVAAAVPLTLSDAVLAGAAPVRTEAAATVTPRAAAPNPASCPEQVALVNGGFERPVVTGTWASLPDASQSGPNAGPGWRTTATDHRIEIWSPRMNVPAAEGAQFAELNANQVSTLYQDRPTTPGQKLYWRLSHRGRLGTDAGVPKKMSSRKLPIPAAGRGPRERRCPAPSGPSPRSTRPST
ncbi:hypothetical protein [Microbispora sp. CSR-4]|uniref:hypothetical protein n=1 Tax=Microbispora sp. CSR-4 TaxID=2592813 RepID=UPI001C9CCEB3|nr:hypothetical protein [Microbispora sp. CSR-4]